MISKAIQKQLDKYVVAKETLEAAILREFPIGCAVEVRLSSRQKNLSLAKVLEVSHVPGSIVVRLCNDRGTVREVHLNSIRRIA